MDVALLPDQRGAGIGTSMLKGLMAEAQRAEKPVRIHVEGFNPALRLYERLGFSEAADKGVYLLMERVPGAG